MAKTKELSLGSTLKTAFIRVHAENNTKDGLVSYTLDDIKKTVEDLSFRYSGLKYAYITHDRDTNPDGPVSKHYHIIIWFDDSKKNIRFKTLKESFPLGSIQTARNRNASIQYLIHKNDPEKFQYKKTEIITNEKQEDFDLLFVNDKKVERINERDELDEIIDKIGKGEIRRFNFDDFISVHLYSKYKTKIENAFAYQDQIFFKNPNRNISVVFVQGPQGKGKTEFAKKAFISDDMLGVGRSSSSNDPFQDYRDEDVFIFDDLRDDVYSFVDFLKIIDPRTSSSVKSRYRNKYFKGKLFIITSFDPLENWYSKVPRDARKQLFRRIDKYVLFDDKYITMYDLDENGVKSNPQQILNPVTLLKKQEDKEKKVDFEGSLDRFASAISEKLTPENLEEYHFSEEKRKFDERIEKQIAEYFGYSEQEDLPF